MNRHQIPAQTLRSLAAGNGGTTAVTMLAAAEHSRSLLLLYGVVEMARESAHPDYGLARSAYDLLAAIERQAPEHANAVVRWPSVGAWAGRTLRTLRGQLSLPGATPAGLAAVAAAAAVRAGFPCSIEVPARDGAVMLPSLGLAGLPRTAAHRDTAVLRARSDAAELAAGGQRTLIPGTPHLDAPGWTGLRRIRSRWDDMRIQMVIDDLDPYRLAAPLLGERLTAGQVAQWQTALRGGWRILCQHHRDTAAELRAAIRVLVPLDVSAPGMRSATSVENFGSIGISSPAGPLLFAVSLAHEVQHAKLSALRNFVQLTHPDDGRRYYAPWREDARPVSGLLQGAYAYLGVAGFWRRQRHEEAGAGAVAAHAEYARWRAAVLLATTQLLESGQLTATGQSFVATMANAARAWHADSVPAQAAGIARASARSHAERWRIRHGRELDPEVPYQR